MNKIDNYGLLLCSIQGGIFERSIIRERCSSNIFIRRYMNSDFALRIDNEGFLYEMNERDQGFDEINEEYGISTYGKLQYSKEEMYWIGYIYRYMCYIYEIKSASAYKIVKGAELKQLYNAYHTLDPLNAIERILESKKITLSIDENIIFCKGVRILRKIKKGDLVDYKR